MGRLTMEKIGQFCATFQLRREYVHQKMEDRRKEHPGISPDSTLFYFIQLQTVRVGLTLTNVFFIPIRYFNNEFSKWTRWWSKTRFYLTLSTVDDSIHNIQHTATLEHNHSHTAHIQGGRCEQTTTYRSQTPMDASDHIGGHPRYGGYAEIVVEPRTEGKVDVVTEVVQHAQFHSILCELSIVGRYHILLLRCEVSEEAQVVPQEECEKGENEVVRNTNHIVCLYQFEISWIMFTRFYGRISKLLPTENTNEPKGLDILSKYVTDRRTFRQD